MSFREFRNFSIYLRYLGYPNHVSRTQFQTPNFDLTATLLQWLLERLDPNADIHLDVETMDERIEFLQTAATIAWQAGEVRLNLRNLYKADGYAVKELVKIAQVLYKAVQLTGETVGNPDFLGGSDLEVLRSSRNLGTKLVTNGANLYEVLGEESQNHPSRDKVVKFLDELAYNLESNEPQKRVEQAVTTQVEKCTLEVERLNLQIQNCEMDEKNLQKKLRRKQAEHERAKKQLQNLKAMELPFMAEQQTLEEELQQLTEIYVETHRNLAWLDAEVAQNREKELLEKKEADRKLKRMQKRLREEQRKLLKGGAEDLDALFEADVDESSSEVTSDGEEPPQREKRPRPSSRRRHMNFREEEELLSHSSEASIAGQTRLDDNRSDPLGPDSESDFESADSNF